MDRTPLGFFREATVGRLAVLMVLLLSLGTLHALTEGPLLPSHRIVGYYGNFYSSKMGILGEYPPEQMLKRLSTELKTWAAADPKTPVIPAIDYIAVVAQKHPGSDGLYRTRMPAGQIKKAIDMASTIKGLAILDVQIGLSTVQAELAHLEPYLRLPHVMLALDPEFSMPSQMPPGKVIGSMDAKAINDAINTLAEIVRTYHLPPKILVIHRFTEPMVRHYQNIKPVPEVQVIMDMDGWGSKAKKLNTYREFIAPEYVEFTGVKLFYKEDLKKPSTGLLSPEQILQFKPTPMFILYQ
jgi:hypothetical protein